MVDRDTGLKPSLVGKPLPLADSPGLACNAVAQDADAFDLHFD